MKRVAVVLFALPLIVLTASPAVAQCASIADPAGVSDTQEHYFAGFQNVVLSPAAGSAPLPPELTGKTLPDATGWWRQKCPSKQFPNIPQFGYKETPGTGDHVLPVRFIDSLPPLPNGCTAYGPGCDPQVAAYATKPTGESELRIYRRCTPRLVAGGVCDGNGNANFSHSFWIGTIAHELGHALGLGHDSELGQCGAVRGLMAATNPGADMRGGEYCDVANEQNCTNPAGCGGPHSVSGTVTGLEAKYRESIEIELSTAGGAISTTVIGRGWSGEITLSQPVFRPGLLVTSRLLSNTNSNKNCVVPAPFVMPAAHYTTYTVKCTCSTPAGTPSSIEADSEDESCPEEDDEDPREIIDQLPVDCDFCIFEPGDDPWWMLHPGPMTGNCETDCEFVGRKCEDIYDENGNLIQTLCYDEYTCTDICDQSKSVSLAGPSISLTSPAPAATVSGRTLITGYANDKQGLQNTYFFLDGNVVAFEDYQTGLDTPEACADWNTPVPCNPNVGFRGYLNLSNVSPGPHKLEILVTDGDPSYPVPTVYERILQVGSACSDTIAPTVTLGTPANGATVNGVVTVTAVPADDIGVTKVELYVDGALRSTDHTAPFTFLWDSRTAANGSHSLKTRAYDDCNNNRESQSVTVTVQNATNRKPKAANDTATTNIAVPVTIRVLDNDTDPDLDPLFLKGIVKEPGHGTAAGQQDGTIRYTPAAAYEGDDAFQYEIEDATGRRDRAWVTVTIAGVNQKPVANPDSATVHGTAAVTIDVTSNDSDPDGNVVRLIPAPVVVQGTRGFAARVSSTSISYTPYAPYTGTDSFQYEIGDGKGKRARATVTITLVDSNRAPVAAADSGTTPANQPITIDVTANDGDPDGDQVFLISNPIVIAPANGTASKVSASSIAYTPHNGFSGSDTFQYEIGDGFGRRARATVAISVTSTNNPPDALDDPIVTTPGVAVTVNVTANDSDRDGDRVTLIPAPVVSPPANGSAVKISLSSITYTPRAGFSGTDRFQYEVGDGRGGRSRAWVDVTVSSTGSVNHNPVAVDDAISTRLDTAIAIAVTANDSDPDGDTVSLITSPVIIPPQHGTAARTSGTAITYTPAPGFIGSDTFQYEVGDGRGKRARAWVRVSVIDSNSRPVAVDDLAAVSMDGVADVVVTSNDSDPDGDPVTLISAPIIVPPAHGTATRKNGTTITYRPVAGFTGTDRLQYEIGDGRGRRARAWINLNVTANVAQLKGAGAVNTAPVAISDVVVTDSAVAVDIDPLSNDYDPDDQALTLSEHAVTVMPQVGAVRRTGDRLLTYYAPSGYAGNDGFEYEISDGQGGTARAWVAVTVGAVNQPPQPKGDWSTTAVNREITIDPLVNDVDPEHDPIRLTERAVASLPFSGSVRRVSDTQVAYAPNAGFAGQDFFYYEVTDGKGHTVASRITVEVIDGSRPPIAANDTLATESGIPAKLDVASNDADPDGDALYVVSSTQPAHGTATWDSGTASVTYVSDPGFVGTDSFTYTISDTHRLEATATVSIAVTPVRHAPVVQNDAATTTTLTGVLIGVLANDYDPDWNRLTVKSVTQPAGGSAVINRSESVMFTPGPGFAGTTSFQYTVSDGTGMESTGTVTVTVLNQSPQPRNDAVGAREDTAFPYDAARFLGNDSDPDGHTLKIVAVTQPANGTLAYSADYYSFSYTPKADWAGIDGFSYTASDGFGGTAQAWVQINVTAVNDSPVAKDDPFTLYKNQLLTIAPNQVLANDTDVESHTLTVSLVGPAANGTTAQLADGTIEYRPHGEFVGADSFEYTIQDQAGGYGTARVNVTVLQDTKPVPGFTVTCNGLACSFNAGTSTDDRGIVLYQWTLGNGQAASGRTFDYTYPAPGLFEVRLTVQDTLGQSAAASKWVTVCQPLAIGAQPASQTVGLHSQATFTVAASGSGPFTYQWYEGASGTATVPVGTNSNTYTTPALTGTRSYWVRVTSTCSGPVSVNSTTATAHVCTPPGVATQPASQTINYNTAATLTVTPGGSGPFTYQWYEGAAGATTKPVGTNSATYTTPLLKANTSYWVRITSTCLGTASTSSSAALITVKGALARRQKGGAVVNSQTSVTASWPQPTQAGNLLVAIISAENGSWPIATFSPPAGWVHAVTSEWNGVKTAIYYYPNNPGGRTAETFTNGGKFRDQILQLAEYEGVAATSPLDKVTTTGNDTNDGIVETGYTAATAQAKELVITAIAVRAPTEFSSASNGFAEMDERTVASWARLTTAVHERFTSSIGSWGHSATVGAPEQWVGAVATFRSTDPQ